MFKQWWSSIPQLSTTLTITSDLNWTHWIQQSPRHIELKIDVLALAQSHVCDCVRPINGIPNLLSCWLDPQQQYIYKQRLKHLDRLSSTQKDNIHVLSLHQMNDNLDFNSTIAKSMNARGHKVL